MHNVDRSVKRFKAHLVAKGFTQAYGIDYQEAFAPVAKLNTIQVLFSFVVNHDWKLHQLDNNNAFLMGIWKNEVYIEIPIHLENQLNPDKVCKLKKSLYSFK